MVFSLLFFLSFASAEEPDHPSSCVILNVSSNAAKLECVPGFDGGGDLTFPVWKNTYYYGEPVLADSTEQWVDASLVLIQVTGLCANMSFTLQIYGENEYGRSDGSYAVYLLTSREFIV